MRPYLAGLGSEALRNLVRELCAATPMVERSLRMKAASAALIEIALGEGDTDAAWRAADEYGLGALCRELADASRVSNPLGATGLHLAQVRHDLKHANTSLYPGIAKNLSSVRTCYSNAGSNDEFTVIIADIRTTYRRQPALMRALDGAHL